MGNSGIGGAIGILFAAYALRELSEVDRERRYNNIHRNKKRKRSNSLRLI